MKTTYRLPFKIILVFFRLYSTWSVVSSQVSDPFLFSCQVLKEILREIDSTLTEDDLDNIIEEVDEDGSGTLDFDEFQEMMMG